MRGAEIEWQRLGDKARGTDIFVWGLEVILWGLRPCTPSLALLLNRKIYSSSLVSLSCYVYMCEQIKMNIKNIIIQNLGNDSFSFF